MAGTGGFINRDGDPADRQNGEVEQNPLVTGFRLESYAVSWLHPSGGESFGNSNDLIAKLGKSNVCPGLAVIFCSGKDVMIWMAVGIVPQRRQ